MFRLILVLITIILYFLVTMPVLLVLFLIGKKNPDLRARIASSMVRFICRIIALAAGMKIEVIGQDRIPNDTAVLYTGNHRSFFDIIATYPYTKGMCGYIAKDSLKKVPLLYQWMQCINCIAFNRSDIKEGMRMIKAGTEYLNNDCNIFVFPEGTRSTNDTELPLLEFHEGTYRMATKSKCPIIPVAITGTADIFEKHVPWIRGNKITVEFCDPIYPDDVPKDMKKKLGLLTSGIIEETIRKNMS